MANIKSDLAALGVPAKAGLTPFGQIVQLGQVNSFGATGPGGSATYDQSGVTSTGPGADLYSLLSGMAGQQAGGGQFSGDIGSILAGLFQSGGASAQSDQANSLFGKFAGDLSTFDQTGRTNDILGRLNAIAQPAEKNAASTLANRLFAKGRLGGQDTTSGRAFGELAKEQDLAQQQRYLTAYDAASKEGAQLSNFANTFGSLGGTLRSSNVGDLTKIAATPGTLAGQNIENASGAINAGNAALDPIYQQINTLFEGLNITSDQKSRLSKAFADKLAANKVSGSGPGALESLGGAALTGIGTAVGGPIGGAIGGQVARFINK